MKYNFIGMYNNHTLQSLKATKRWPLKDGCNGVE